MNKRVKLAGTGETEGQSGFPARRIFMRISTAVWLSQTAGTGDAALIGREERPEGKAGSAWTHSADGRRPPGGPRGSR
jgi:hypothetical protein